MKSFADVAKDIAYFCFLTYFSYLAISAGKQGVSNMYFRRAFAEEYNTMEKLENIKAAIRLTPDNAEYYEKMGQLHLENAGNSGDETLDTVSYQQAIESYRIAIDLNPANYKYHLFHALSEFRAAGDADRFVAAFKKIEMLDPHNQIISKYKEKLLNF